MRAGNLGVPTTTEWLNGELSPGCRVGIDPVGNVNSYVLLLTNKHEILVKGQF